MHDLPWSLEMLSFGIPKLSLLPHLRPIDTRVLPGEDYRRTVFSGGYAITPMGLGYRVQQLVTPEEALRWKARAKLPRIPVPRLQADAMTKSATSQQR